MRRQGGTLMSNAIFTVQIETEGEEPSGKELIEYLKTATPATRLVEFKIKSIIVLAAKTPAHFDLIDEMAELAERHEVDPDGLDELVHDLKSGEAASINNGGARAQIEIIVDSAQSLKAARAELLKAIKDGAQEGMVICPCCKNEEFREKAHLDRDKRYVCDKCFDERMR
jgi:hypothetical protein